MSRATHLWSTAVCRFRQRHSFSFARLLYGALPWAAVLGCLLYAVRWRGLGEWVGGQPIINQRGYSHAPPLEDRRRHARCSAAGQLRDPASVGYGRRLKGQHGALGRKSWLFAGSDRGGERAALIYTLIGTAKLNKVDPQAWLADTLARINDILQSRLQELLPWNWVQNTEYSQVKLAAGSTPPSTRPTNPLT
jgi:hypothetical protein